MLIIFHGVDAYATGNVYSDLSQLGSYVGVIDPDITGVDEHGIVRQNMQFFPPPPPSTHWHLPFFVTTLGWDTGVLTVMPYSRSDGVGDLYYDYQGYSASGSFLEYWDPKWVHGGFPDWPVDASGPLSLTGNAGFGGSLGCLDAVVSGCPPGNINPIGVAWYYVTESSGEIEIHLVQGEQGGTPNPSPPPPHIDMDVEGWENDADEAKEENPGPVTVRNYDNNNAPRKEIIVKKVDNANDDFQLTLAENSNHLDLYDAATQGNKINFTNGTITIRNGDIPAGGQKYYVQGITPSDNMRDEVLTLQGGGASDTIKFTVLWVTITAKTNGETSPQDDNGAHDWLRDNLDIVELGIWVDIADRFGISIELKGQVTPSDFTESIILDRDCANRTYVDKSYSGSAKQFRATIPPGNDRSNAIIRDDDPQSGTSTGQIYDTDCPGVFWQMAPVGTVVRSRYNTKQFAVYKIGAVEVRCSEVAKWYCAVSGKFNGPHADDWVQENTVAGDNTIAFGSHCIMTADLKPVEIQGVAPASGKNNAAVNVTVSGASLDPGCVVVLKKGTIIITGTNVTPAIDGKSLTCDFDLNGKEVGKYDIVITNPDTGQTEATVKAEAFEVQAP